MGALAHSGRGWEGHGMWGGPAAAEAGVTLHQPEGAVRAFSGKVVPGSWDTGSGGLDKFFAQTGWC